MSETLSDTQIENVKQINGGEGVGRTFLLKETQEIYQPDVVCRPYID